jgi:HK97 family phage major capsid protein
MATNIAELKRVKSGLIAEMKTIVTKDGDMDEGDKSRFDELEKSVADHDDRIGKLEDVMQLEADNAAPADSEEMATIVPVQKISKAFTIGSPKRPANEAKGTRFARFLIGAGIASKQGSNAGMRYVQDNFGDAEVVKALNTTTQASGGALIPADFKQELVDLLYSATIVRGSGCQVVSMPMGNLTWPRLNGSAVAAWQATELQDMVVTGPTWDDIQFQAHKLTAIVPVTNFLLRTSPLSVESIVRTNSVKMLARAEDIAFLTSAGSATVPTGMTALAASANVFTVTASPTLSVVNNALVNAELSLKSANVPVDKAVWIFNPSVRSFLSTLTDSVGRYFFREELDRGTLIGYPIKETTQLPSNLGGGTNETQIIFAAIDECIIADTLNMYADSSSEATYVSGGTTYSAYQRDETVFRILEEVDFNVSHPNAISVTTVEAWSPTGYVPNAGAAFSTQPANTTPSAAGSANPV